MEHYAGIVGPENKRLLTQLVFLLKTVIFISYPACGCVSDTKGIRAA
jgi:hypothetical protein